ncbi:MAG: hypothetical protein R3Y65_00490 [Bacillota bacterium]
MTNNIVTKYEVLKEAGAICASAITTPFVELDNYKYVDFVVQSGEGTEAETTVTMVGKNGEDGEEVAIPFREKIGACEYADIAETGKTISIGGEEGACGYAVFRVSTDHLAKDEINMVALKTTAVASSEVAGGILAICYEPRYSE